MFRIREALSHNIEYTFSNYCVMQVCNVCIEYSLGLAKACALTVQFRGYIYFSKYGTISLNSLKISGKLNYCNVND